MYHMRRRRNPHFVARCYDATVLLPPPAPVERPNPWPTLSISEQVHIVVTVVVTGPPEDVQRFAEGYVKAYDPCGYDTFVESPHTLENGNIQVRITRAKGCD